MKCRQAVFFNSRGVAENCHVKPLNAIAAAAQQTRCAIVHQLPTAPGQTMAASVRQTPIAAAAQRTRCAIDPLGSPRPAGAGAAWCKRGAASCPACLTPARSSAINLAGQISAPDGSGGAVLTGTGRELRQNFQSIANAALFARFSGFSDCASRDVCAYVCACTRAYMREGFPRTREPFCNVVQIHKVDGSRAVLARFSSEPASDGAALGTADLLRGNILAGGYALVGSSWSSIGRGMGVARGRGGETFGVSGRAGSPGRVGAGRARVQLEVVQAIGRNGGFLRFPGLTAGCVGRVMLEGWPQGRGNAGLSRPAPLPVRLAAGAPWCGRGGGSIAARTPPCAPARRGPASSRVARQSGRILIDLRPEAIRGGCAAPAGGRQTGGVTAGSGVGAVSIAARRGMRATGRGEAAAGRDCRLALRRSGHASAGVADVN